MRYKVIKASYDYSKHSAIASCFCRSEWFGKKHNYSIFYKAGIYTNADDMVSTTGMSNEEAAKLADEKRYHSIECKEDFLLKQCYLQNINLTF